MIDNIAVALENHCGRFVRDDFVTHPYISGMENNDNRRIRRNINRWFMSIVRQNNLPNNIVDMVINEESDDIWLDIIIDSLIPYLRYNDLL